MGDLYGAECPLLRNRGLVTRVYVPIALSSTGIESPCLCSHSPPFTKPFPALALTAVSACCDRHAGPSIPEAQTVAGTDVAHLGTSLPSRTLGFWEHGLGFHAHLSQLVELMGGLHCCQR